MLSKLKNQKGFTLIEILVVVIIVASCRPRVPRYLRYVEKSRSTEAQTAISTLRKVFDVKLQTDGTTEGFTKEQALKEARLVKAPSKTGSSISPVPPLPNTSPLPPRISLAAKANRFGMTSKKPNSMAMASIPGPTRNPEGPKPTDLEELS
jgi:prepilin-type N-terminal cleavage/methylation domain-containing protein